MKFIRSYIRIIDNFSEKSGSIISWFTLALVLVVCYDVFTRYFLREGSVALQELEWHIFSIIFILGAAYTLKVDEHVRVDVFYSKLTEKKQAWINLIGTILFLIPFTLLVIYSSKEFVFASWRVSETSPDAGGLPARYILKTIIPVSFFMMFLQGTSMALKSYLKIKSSSAEDELKT